MTIKTCLFIVFTSILIYRGDALMKLKLNKKEIVPVFTPFNNNGSIALNMIPPYAKYLHNNNLTTIWILPVVGEPFSLNLQEKKTIINAWLEALQCYGNSFTVIVGVGFLTVMDSCELARYCEKKKINAIVYKIPSDAGALTPKQAQSDFGNVAKCAPKTPVFYLYNTNFIYCNRNPNIGLVIQLTIKNVPNYAGIIAPVEEILIVRATNPDCTGQLIVFFYYSVSAAYLLQFDAFATPFSNFLVEDIRLIVAACTNSASLRAQDKFLSRDATPLCFLRPECRLICPINILKAAMEEKTGVRVGNTREPLCPVTKRDREDVAAILNRNN